MLPYISVSCTQFQPEGGKMIVSSFSEPLKLICPPEVSHSAALNWTSSIGNPAPVNVSPHDH